MGSMALKGRAYLVVIEYCVKYPKLALLEHRTSESVIAHMKNISARIGIPEEIVATISYLAELERKRRRRDTVNRMGRQRAQCRH